ncbi:MAG: helix-turn-helix transcriptional regulator [Bacteroidota bacterium]
MNNEYYVSDKKDPEDDLDYFLKSLGEYIRLEREKAGFNNASEFALLIDIAESQYREYERGETDLRISSLLKIFKGLDRKSKDVFSFDIFSRDSEIQKEKFQSEYLETQVRHQVSLITDIEYEQNLTSLEINRIYKILVHCLKYRTKQEITKYLGLAGKTKNFQTIFNLLLVKEWIAMKSPEKPNTPRQRYYTTSIGKKVMQIR